MKAGVPKGFPEEVPFMSSGGTTVASLLLMIIPLLVMGRFGSLAFYYLGQDPECHMKGPALQH